MDISIIDTYLKKYAETTPADGMHIGYLSKAWEVFELYKKVIAIMEEERTPENVAKVKDLAEKIKKIIE